MKQLLNYIFLFSSFTSICQDVNFTSQDISINKYIDGTLLTPKEVSSAPLAIIITDSGPTDRNGNQNFQNNNAIKKLSEELSNKNIATFRYDKRIVKQIKKGKVDPNMSFDDFIADANSVIEYFKSEGKFSKIIVIGHGQGSLVGLVASINNVDQFISIAGSGKSIDQVIIDQVTQMDPALESSTVKAFEALKNGTIINDYPQALGSIFSPDVQPFMMSWIKYNPQVLIKELSIPTLILNGTKDLQVSVAEAELLKNASTKAKLSIIDNMNHVLFIIEGKELENSKSYNESFRPISTELIDELVSFISNQK